MDQEVGLRSSDERRVCSPMMACPGFAIPANTDPEVFGVAMLGARIRHGLTRIGELTAHPVAFGLVALYAIAWLILSPDSFGWGAIATLATWLMTLFITRTEHRDTQAIHAKLDELLRAEGRARTELTLLDDEEPEVIELHRAQERFDQN